MVEIKEDKYGELHLVSKSGHRENGRLILSETDARDLQDQLRNRFEKQDRDALAEALTRGN